MKRVARFHEGKLVSVYDDRWLPLYRALGQIEIRRATTVEYEDGEWVARLVDTGEVIARGRTRQEVIEQEIEYLNKRLES